MFLVYVDMTTGVHALLSMFGIFWGVLGTRGREGGQMGPKLCCFDLLCCLHLLLGVTLHAGKQWQTKNSTILMTQGKWHSFVDHCTLVCLCLTSVVGLDAGTESSTTSAKLRFSFGIGYPEVRWIVKNRPTLQSFN